MAPKPTLRESILKTLGQSRDGLTVETLQSMDAFLGYHRTSVPLALRLLLQSGSITKDQGGVFRATRKSRPSYRKEEGLSVFTAAGGPLDVDTFVRKMAKTDPPEWGETRRAHIILGMLSKSGAIRRVSRGVYALAGLPVRVVAPKNGVKTHPHLKKLGFVNEVLKCIPQRGAVGPRDICLLMPPAIVARYKNLEVLRIAVSGALSYLLSRGCVERPFPGKYLIQSTNVTA